MIDFKAVEAEKATVFFYTEKNELLRVKITSVASDVDENICYVRYSPLISEPTDEINGAVAGEALERFFMDMDSFRKWKQKQVNSTTLCESIAGMYGVGIYEGSPTTGMELIPNDRFDWHIENDGEYEEKYITLKDIYEQAVAKGIIEPTQLLTVFTETPLDGAVYVCNNYGGGNWSVRGALKGFA